MNYHVRLYLNQSLLFRYDHDAENEPSLFIHLLPDAEQNHKDHCVQEMLLSWNNSAYYDTPGLYRKAERDIARTPILLKSNLSSFHPRTYFLLFFLYFYYTGIIAYVNKMAEGM